MSVRCAGRRFMTKPRRYKRFSSEFKREAIMRASGAELSRINDCCCLIHDRNRGAQEIEEP